MAIRSMINANNRVTYISVPSQIINSLSSSRIQSILDSPKKSSRSSYKFLLFSSYRNPRAWFFTLFFFGLIGMLELGYKLDPSLTRFSPIPCVTSLSKMSLSKGYLASQLNSEQNVQNVGYTDHSRMVLLNKHSDDHSRMVLLNKDSDDHSRMVMVNKDSDYHSKMVMVNKDSENGDIELYSESNDSKSEFWKQPDGLGYRPCLNFSEGYVKDSTGIIKNRRKYLLVVVAGGINQQKNQIVDAVVIARILGAALVVPVLQVNVIWGDESEFSDIFDLEHFKKVLANDVRIVSTLPSTHIRTRPVEQKSTPLHASPEWIRAHYLKRLTREGVLLLRGLDSRLSKDLPSDLQKLRCKVAFDAIRFAPKIMELGNKLAERMRRKGPYLALHLRMEKDVWVRTGCLPGLTPEYDEVIYSERKQRPNLLTDRLSMTYHQRKLAGLCPLNAVEVTRLLKALRAPSNARIYWAGGQPLGGKEALLPLITEYPHFYNKNDIALPDELEPFANKASSMAAVDYIVCENSDVFMPSHGGNMAHAIQGQRAYAGHKKFITPNKRHMLRYFLNSSLPEAEFNRIIQRLHKDSLGQPELRNKKPERDVTKYPVPECMCKNTKADSV